MNTQHTFPVGNSAVRRFKPETEPQVNPVHQWKGPGPAPAWWFASDGTKVYRSLYDYYDV